MRVRVRSRRWKLWLLFIIIAIAAVIIFGLFAWRAVPVFKIRAAEAASQAALKIVSNTAGKMLDDNVSLFDQSVDLNGEIRSLRINSARVNKLKSDFTNELIESLSECSNTKIYIPIGSLFNCVTLQGCGIKIPVSVTYASTCDVEIIDEFITSGINQTKYMLCLNVKVKVAVISAFMYETKDIETILPVCENIIVGGIPKYYSDRLNVSSGGITDNDKR